MWPLALAGIVGSVASAFGQRSANKQNVQLSREGMAFEGEQARQQMAFQERMSNSSYQRASEDMRLAGINPMLAYAQGGASTPSGAGASGAAATVQDVVGPAVSSAMSAARLNQELKNMRQVAANVNQDTRLKSDQTYATRQQVAESKARERQHDADAALAKSQMRLYDADYPARKVAGEVGGGTFGRGTEYLRRGLGAVAPLAGAAAGALFGRFARPQSVRPFTINNYPR